MPGSLSQSCIRSYNSDIHTRYVPNFGSSREQSWLIKKLGIPFKTMLLKYKCSENTVRLRKWKPKFSQDSSRSQLQRVPKNMRLGRWLGDFYRHSNKIERSFYQNKYMKNLCDADCFFIKIFNQGLVGLFTIAHLLSKEIGMPHVFWDFLYIVNTIHHY